MHSLVSRKINSYFAILLITLIGSGATLVIMHVANETNFDGYGNASPLSADSGTSSDQ